MNLKLACVPFREVILVLDGWIRGGVELHLLFYLENKSMSLANRLFLPECIWGINNRCCNLFILLKYIDLCRFVLFEC